MYIDEHMFDMKLLTVFGKAI